MAVAPQRFRVVEFYEAPTQFVIDVKPGFPDAMNEIAVTKRTERCPVLRVTPFGRDVVMFRGKEMEL
jgi:hypothetical protein